MQSYSEDLDRQMRAISEHQERIEATRRSIEAARMQREQSLRQRYRELVAQEEAARHG